MMGDFPIDSPGEIRYISPHKRDLLSFLIRKGFVGNSGDLFTEALLYYSSRGKINNLIKWQGRW
jgi:hypothetical protein